MKTELEQIKEMLEALLESQAKTMEAYNSMVSEVKRILMENFAVKVRCAGCGMECYESDINNSGLCPGCYNDQMNGGEQYV